MQSTTGRRLSLPGRVAGRTASRWQQPIIEEFHPSAGWSQNGNAHILLIGLRGFNKDDVKIQMDAPGSIIVSGQKQVDDNKYRRFKQTYQMPEDSIQDQISWTMENENLFISMPKKKVQMKAESDVESTTAEAELQPTKLESKDGNQTGKEDAMQTKDSQATGTDVKNQQETIPPKKTEISTEDDSQKKEKPSNETKTLGDAYQKKETPTIEMKTPDKDTGRKEEAVPKVGKIGEEIEKKEKQLGTAESHDKQIKNSDVEAAAEAGSAIDESKRKRNGEPQHRLGVAETAVAGTNGSKEGTSLQDNTCNQNNNEGARSEDGFLKSFLEMINKNKEIIATAVMAFTLGLFVSHRKIPPSNK